MIDSYEYLSKSYLHTLSIRILFSFLLMQNSIQQNYFLCPTDANSGIFEEFKTHLL